METMMWIIIYNFGAVAALMTLGWTVSVIYRNVTVVDSLWGLGFVLIAWLSLAMAPVNGARQWLLVLLTTSWGVRLSVHLSWRNWGRGEDPRYGAWRQKSGGNFWWVSLFKVFWLQALFLWVIGLALQMGVLRPGPPHWTWLDAAGSVAWVAGFFFESVGDWQLARFKSDPANKGRTMNKGLWTYTRHPNYFGEFLMWWGVYLVALSNADNWWTFLSPVILSLVLTKMTGIALTEAAILEKRPQYRAYMASTSAFFPLPPKKRSTTETS